MKSIHTGWFCRPFGVLLAGAVVWAFCFPNGASAQKYYRYSEGAGIIGPNTMIIVRTIDGIDTNESDGRVFMGAVDQDVTDKTGNIVIPKGSDVELVVRRVSRNEVAVDLDSLTIHELRYGVETQENPGAMTGAIIGAIGPGGRRAAIGAGAVTAPVAGVAQVLTRGNRVWVPAESLLTFELARPLRAGVVDNGYYTEDGIHYHCPPVEQAYNYEREKPGNRGGISIGIDRAITWQGPNDSSVWVLTDGRDPKLFAEGAYGTKPTWWMERGHVYTVILRDSNGGEIARDQWDMRY